MTGGLFLHQRSYEFGTNCAQRHYENESRLIRIKSLLNRFIVYVFTLSASCCFLKILIAVNCDTVEKAFRSRMTHTVPNKSSTATICLFSLFLSFLLCPQFAFLRAASWFPHNDVVEFTTTSSALKYSTNYARHTVGTFPSLVDCRERRQQEAPQ
jgi:hypothetical protein